MSSNMEDKKKKKQLPVQKYSKNEKNKKKEGTGKITKQVPSK